MEKESDSNLEDIIFSNMIQIEAILRVLEKKQITSLGEVIEEMQKIRDEMRREFVKN